MYKNKYSGRKISDLEFDRLPASLKEDFEDESSFGTSAIIGAVTGSALLGGIIGGDIVGGVVGDLLDGDLFD